VYKFSLVQFLASCPVKRLNRMLVEIRFCAFTVWLKNFFWWFCDWSVESWSTK